MCLHVHLLMHRYTCMHTHIHTCLLLYMFIHMHAHAQSNLEKETSLSSPTENEKVPWSSVFKIKAIELCVRTHLGPGLHGQNEGSFWN